MRVFAVLVIVSSFGCDSESKPASRPPKQPEPTRPDQALEIAKQPRITTAARTTFLEFTIDLPRSASRPFQGKRVTSWTFKDSKLAVEVREVNSLPSESEVKLERGHIVSVDDGKKTVKEEPGAYLVIDRRHSPTGINAQGAALRVEYCRDLDRDEPPSGICCRLLGDDSDALVAFAEQVCRSIRVTNRKTTPRPG